jgi:hypothetical protein
MLPPSFRKRKKGAELSINTLSNALSIRVLTETSGGKRSGVGITAFSCRATAGQKRGQSVILALSPKSLDFRFTNQNNERDYRLTPFVFCPLPWT